MFCRKCGVMIPDDSLFCTRCGTAVQGSAPPPVSPLPAAAAGREYIEVFHDVTAKDKYDMYLADNRLVMIKLEAGSGSSMGLLGPMGPVLEAGVSKMRRKKYDDDLTLDQKIRRDKDNLSIEYASIASARLGKGKLGGMIFQVRYRDPLGSEKKLDVSLKEEQFDRLAVTIPAIPMLSPKLLQKTQAK